MADSTNAPECISREEQMALDAAYLDALWQAHARFTGRYESREAYKAAMWRKLYGNSDGPAQTQVPAFSWN